MTSKSFEGQRFVYKKWISITTENFIIFIICTSKLTLLELQSFLKLQPTDIHGVVPNKGSLTYTIR